jgi:hypothetical protein
MDLLESIRFLIRNEPVRRDNELDNKYCKMMATLTPAAEIEHGQG